MHLFTLKNCSTCGKDFMTKTELDAHQSKHNETPTWQCEKCFKFYQHKSTLITHKKQCNGKPKVSLAKKNKKEKKKQ